MSQSFLTILEDRDSRNVICRCICGKEVTVKRSDLKRGTTKSCGCKSRELISKARTIHGHSKNVGGNRVNFLYERWRAMMKRCYNPNSRSYPNYGGRGIQVCSEWHDPAVFIAWAESTFATQELSIERIDCNGNYCPENCEWIGIREQQGNKRSNVHVIDNGETICLAEYVRRYGKGISYVTVKWRVRHGATPEEAIRR